MTTGFRGALENRPLVLDAAMGTRLISRGLDLSNDDPAFWNLSRPEEVAKLHELDRRAGADVVLTNTFGANQTWLARWGRGKEVEAINRAAVRLARASAGFVLGSIGPSAWNPADPSVLLAQADILLDAGVDALILETFTRASAMEAVSALRVTTNLPIIASVLDLTADCARLVDAGADAIGVNCVHPTEAARMLGTLAVKVPLLWKPSAAQPGKFGLTPGEFARDVPELVTRGVRLFGACCGGDSDHLAEVRRLLSWQASR